MNQYLPHRNIVILITLLVLVISGLALFLFKGPGKPSLTNRPQQTNPNLTLLQVVPDGSSELNYGQQQLFKVVLAGQVSTSELKINLTRTDRLKKTPINQVDITAQVDQSNTLIIQTTKPIDPFSDYHLLITDLSGKTILDQDYVTPYPSPSPAVNNNLQLVKFLPYETTNYRLSYDQTRNIYIFNFKFNSSLTDDPETQFEKAQKDATSFIVAKGIDINSIIIEWRHT